MNTTSQSGTALAEHYARRPISGNVLPGEGVFEREIRRFFSVPIQTIAGPLGNSLLFYAIFSITFGSKPGGANELSLGHSFVSFLIPGLMSMEIINGAFQNPVSSLMIAKWTGTIVEQIMAPLSPFATWLAYVCGAAVRCLIVGLASYIVGSLFAGEIIMVNFPMALLCLLLTAVMFASIGIIAGVKCRDFDQISLIGTFVIQPLVFMSGVFFSFQGIAPSLAWLPRLNPIFYIVNFMRQSLLGVGDVSLLTAGLVTTSFAGMLAVVSITYLSQGKGLRH
jgi:ABC-2 type transport system permease protein